jgi:hypothetical protein
MSLTWSDIALLSERCRLRSGCYKHAAPSEQPSQSSMSLPLKRFHAVSSTSTGLKPDVNERSALLACMS